nr:MAG TPA: hypothetical protein [Caudoviricetes sp.]
MNFNKIGVNYINIGVKRTSVLMTVCSEIKSV